MKKLNVLIDTNWAEASELVTHIESLAEDDAFPARELAAAVASKVRSRDSVCGLCISVSLRPLRRALWRANVAARRRGVHAKMFELECYIGLCCPPIVQCYYHLEEYGEALRLALGAGHHFDVNAKTEYVETIVGQSSIATI